MDKCPQYQRPRQPAHNGLNLFYKYKCDPWWVSSLSIVLSKIYKMSNIACMSAHQYYVTAFRHQSVCAVLPLEEKVISFSIRCENTKYIFMNVSVL